MNAGTTRMKEPGRWARFAKARLYEVGQKLTECATTPGFAKAWSRGWELSHAGKLCRWKEQGFVARHILDVGANHGAWSDMCQEIYNPISCNLIEPQADLSTALLERARTIHPNWKVFEVALGSQTSQLELHLTENRAASSLLRPMDGTVPGTWGTRSDATRKVRVVRLDDLVDTGEMPQPDLVKIDVQGFEAEVIAGGSRVLRNARRLVVEVSLSPIYQGQPLLYDILKSLEELGYVTDDLSEGARSWPDGKLWQVDLWMRKKND